MLDVIDYVESLASSLDPIIAIYRVASFIHRVNRQSSTRAALSLNMGHYQAAPTRHQESLSRLLIEVERGRAITDTRINRMMIEIDFFASQAELSKQIWTNDRFPAHVQERAAIAWSELNIAMVKHFGNALVENASTPILVFTPLPLFE